MNPLTNMKNVKKLSEQELQSSFKTSWHDQYRNSAWLFVGGLPYDLTEGDIICIFSQYGEVVNINLIRDKDSGKSKGFCFICYEDQRSTDLAVDNFNGIKILNRTIRVDHVNEYKVPKDSKKTDAETKQLHQEGCAPNPINIKPTLTPVDDIRETLADQIVDDIKLPPRLPIHPIKEEVVECTTTDNNKKVKVKKEKKKKKSKKKSKKRKKKSSSDETEESSDDESSRSDASGGNNDKHKHKKHRK